MGVVEHVVVPQSHSVPLLATVPSMLEHVAPKVVTGNKQRIRRHGKSLFILSVRSHGFTGTLLLKSITVSFTSISGQAVFNCCVVASTELIQLLGTSLGEF